MRRGARRLSYLRNRVGIVRVRVGDESGIALVLALMVMFVLTSLLATSIVLTSGGERHAQRSNSSQRSDALAESGLNNALAQLNAHYPTDGSTVPSSSWCSSPAPQSYDNGTVTWSCTYDPATTYWTLSGVGTRKSTGGGGNVVRTAKARIKVNQQLDAPSGDTGDRYGLVSGDPNAACTTLGGGVSVNVSIYAASCLILTGNSGAAPAKVWEHRVAP